MKKKIESLLIICLWEFTNSNNLINNTLNNPHITMATNK